MQNITHKKRKKNQILVKKTLPNVIHKKREKNQILVKKTLPNVIHKKREKNLNLVKKTLYNNLQNIQWKVRCPIYWATMARHKYNVFLYTRTDISTLMFNRNDWKSAIEK